MWLFERDAVRAAEVAALREEIARLKGLKGRPKLKPSGMEQATEGKARRGKGKRRGGGAKTARLAIDEERIVKADVPLGSRLKGYQDFVVQELVVRRHVIRFRRERWRTPTGETVVAPLPPGFVGHFGPGLRRFVLGQHYQGQVTTPRLTEQLNDFGIAISKRQVHRLLNERTDGFLAEDAGVLRAGLETARWITVDDTGARHKGRNGTCTRIGNDHFTWFASRISKSRLNFLDLLRAGHGDYVVNQAAVDYMRLRKLAGPVIDTLIDQEVRGFPDDASWQAHLRRLGISALKVQPDPVRIATEAALWGSIAAHGLLADAVIVSDDAGQFNVGYHGLCWIHAERLIHKLDAFTEERRRAKERIQAEIWQLYADLKAYCRDPTPGQKRQLADRFDTIFTTRTGFVSLDRLLARLHANKAELLVALDRPEIPLHTNGAENDIRCQVIKRKISGGTRSDQGRDCRDAFLGLRKTCQKLGIRFWSYLGSRLLVPETPDVRPLPQLIRQHAAL